MSEEKNGTPIIGPPMSITVEPDTHDPAFELQKILFAEFVKTNPEYFGIAKNKPDKFWERAKDNNEIIDIFLSACGYEKDVEE